MGRIIAIANQKGGVGKTTTAVNLSAALAEEGKRVLAIDFDPQGNMTSGLGLNKDTLVSTVYDLIIDEIPIEQVVRESYLSHLDILPSNIDLSGAEVELLDAKKREKILKTAIKPTKEQYDYVIIDCPPSLSLLTINAFTAADSVIIPIQCEYYALEGLTQMIKTIDLIKQRLNTKLEIEGILFTMFDARNNLSSQVVESVQEALNERIFKTMIPRNVRLAEAPSYGMPILEYDDKSMGSQSYRALAKELISEGV